MDRAPSPPERYVGLMSGTSLDGIDAVLVRFDDRDARPLIEAALTVPMAESLRAMLEEAIGTGTVRLDTLGRLDRLLGASFAEAVEAVLALGGLEPDEVRAIGCPGQTLWHAPEAEPPFTLQIGDPNVVAERTGIAVVADLRRRDVAAGGQGAPLVPAFHAAVFHAPGRDTAVLNIGGIANLTLLPGDARAPVRGFDTGPGNTLLDAWARRHLHAPFDADGKLAARGRVHKVLLRRLLADPWFETPPPRSAGRERFHLGWVEAALNGLGPLPPEDVQATLAALTVEAAARALRATQPGTRHLLVCGGGARNPVLMAGLRRALPEAEVTTTATAGLDPDYVEAAAFAWLARETLAGRPGNLPDATGAQGPRVLGCVYPGRRAPWT